MKKAPWWVWAIGAAVIVAAVVGGVFIGRMTADGPETAGPSDEPTSSVEPTSGQTPTLPTEDGSDETPAETPKPRTVRVYFARGEKLGVALRTIPATKAVATAAVQQLLLGTTSVEQGYGLSTEVPVGTDLLGLSIENGTATVDLSGDFESGGGTLSVDMRLAQLVYTLTQFGTVDRVVLYMDGEKVDLFSGEGLMIEDPMVRADFESVLPAIFVEGPTPGSTATSPLRIWGTANTFEAAFMVRIEDPDGGTILEKPAMASSGSGTRGTFDLTLPFETPKTGMGTLVLYEASAMDGSPINVIEIPIKMMQ